MEVGRRGEEGGGEEGGRWGGVGGLEGGQTATGRVTISLLTISTLSCGS